MKKWTVTDTRSLESSLNRIERDGQTIHTISLYPPNGAVIVSWKEIVPATSEGKTNDNQATDEVLPAQ